MKVIELPNLREGYVDLVDFVATRGLLVSPRGRETFEVENATFTVADLSQTLPIGVGRRLNPHIGALEAAQLIAGMARSDLLCAVAPSFEDFNEPGMHEHYGAYGARVGTQLSDVLTKLRSDEDSRQAIIALWDRDLDNQSGHKDYPCTLVLGFRLRGDRLNMSVTMRSNDVWLGTAYDVFQFTQLQMTIAQLLDVEPGTYFHTAWSLHLYLSDVDKASDLHKPMERDSTPYLPEGCDPAYLRRLLYHSTNSDNIAQPLNNSEGWYYTRIKAAYDALENP